jgi:dienelactone hydrolase
MRRRRRLALALLLGIALAAGAAVLEYGRGAAFVARAAGSTGVVRRLADWRRQAVTEAPVAIPWRGGTLTGRRYVPQRPTGRPLLLVPGVHPSGIDEPRLAGFARELAAAGHPTVTAALPDLTRYSITPGSTDMIEDAALWLLAEAGGVEDRRIGVIGISFAGGLAVVAASRPALLDRVAVVVSVGGHGDLPRTLRYLATGVQPDGTLRPPHDYGVAIILLGVADRVVPAGQAAGLRSAILSFLEASILNAVSRAEADAAAERTRVLAAALDEPARTLLTYLQDRDVARLGAVLVPHVDALGGDPALSPAQHPPPRAAVYLLHGRDDNVIPSIESAMLARTLAARGGTVRFLASPLLTHANVERGAAASAAWALVRFWSGVLDE